MKNFILIFFGIFIFSSSGFCQADTQQAVSDTVFRFSPDRPFRVAVKATPPFIIEDTEGSYDGLSIALWEEVADHLDLEFDYVAYEDLAEVLEAIENEEVDIAINPLTVTPDRLRQMNFTQPFFITNLSIAAGTQQKSAIGRFFGNLFSPEFFAAVALLALVIAGFGFLTWVFERKHNSDEFSNNSGGLWDAFWWSAVTMTTVGYGDKAPKSPAGRAVALVWMFTAVIIISGFTASIASSLTVDNLKLSISSVEDLKTARVVAVEASSAENFLESKKISYSTVPSTHDALEAVASGKYDALVYDEPIMRYEISELGLNEKISVAPAKFVTQYYAFGLPYSNKEALPAINLALINVINSNSWKGQLSRFQLE